MTARLCVRLVMVAWVSFFTVACDAANASGGPSYDARGFLIDGSSTVEPIVAEMLESFRQRVAEAKFSLRASGTGGGFRKFCAGETHINGASRAISASEVEQCKQAGVAFIELPIAYDGVVLAVPHGNTWASELSVSELKQIWAPEAQGKVVRWRQIRSYFPDQALDLVSPGADSGTYDYFTQVIVGRAHESRSDVISSEDDEVIVQSIARNPNALGYVGYGHYVRNKHLLKALAIDDERDDTGKGSVLPAAVSIGNGTYQPLARPLFLYINKRAARTKVVDKLMRFALDGATSPELVARAGYVAFAPKVYELVRRRFVEGTVGSAFSGRIHHEPVEAVLDKRE